MNAACASRATEFRSDPQAVPYVAWPAIGAGFGALWFCQSLGLGLGWTVLVIAGFFVLAATVMLHVTLRPGDRTVTRTLLLFGRWVVFREEIPFDAVVAVCFRPFKDADSGDRVMVGVRLRDGRKMWLRAFDVGEGPIGCEARSYARQVSAGTGFPLDEATG